MESVVFEQTIHFDCFRAAAYKLFNIKPLMNMKSSSSEITGKFLVTYLYQKGDEVLSSKQMVAQLPESWRLKGKSFNLDERSSRELILLYANSDIIIRQYKGRDDDYYSLFLLPRNGYIQIQDVSVYSKSWTEVNSKGLRIIFAVSDLYHSSILNQLQNIIVRVQRRKYRVSL